MSFIRTEAGFVNLQHVAKIEAEKEDDFRHVLYGGDRKPLGICDDDPDWELILGDVIPATAGASAYIVWVFEERNGERPREVAAREYPVVAWRLHRVGVAADNEYAEYAHPILPAAPDGYRYRKILLPMGDGKLMECDREVFEIHNDLEAAKAETLRWAQSSWDYRQKLLQEARIKAMQEDTHSPE